MPKHSCLNLLNNNFRNRQDLLKAVIFCLLLFIMPGRAKSKCSSIMGKQIVHCTNTISSIQELSEEIDFTTSVIVLKDFEGFKIDSEEHINEKFKSVTSYLLTRIKPLDLAENSFMGLSNLLILKFADNTIDVLRAGVFKGLYSLEMLELINCNIKYIDEKALDGLTNLQSLDLTNNNIKTISKRLFQNVPNLNSLALYKNEIRTIDIDCFQYLTRLTTLGLSGNKLKVINAEAFNAIPKLTYLYLSFNQVEKIIGDFRCFNLRFLNLGRNSLTGIPRNLFKFCRSLVDIDVAFNNLTYIDEYAFANLPRLMNLHLRNCTVDTIGLKFINKPLIVL